MGLILYCIVVFLLSYVWLMLGVTIGYHRLLAHRSFKCPKPVEYFWVLTGYLAFQASPIFWATTHRAHHRYTDTPLDPHSPRYTDWKYAYFGWISQKGYPAHIDPCTQSKDMVNDPIYRFLEQGGDWHKGHLLSALIGFGSRIAMGFLFGWPFALANLAAALTVQQIPLLLNVVCHLPKGGYKNFPGSDDSVNVPWVALLTLGEGWHNNHHAFPGSARHGMRRREIDPTWLFLRLMKRIGLIGWMHDDSNKIVEPKAPAKAPAKCWRAQGEQRELIIVSAWAIVCLFSLRVLLWVSPLVVMPMGKAVSMNEPRQLD